VSNREREGGGRERDSSAAAVQSEGRHNFVFLKAELKEVVGQTNVSLHFFEAETRRSEE